MGIIDITHKVPEHMTPYYFTAGSSMVYEIQSNGTNSTPIAMACSPMQAAVIVHAMNNNYASLPEY